MDFLFFLIVGQKIKIMSPRKNSQGTNMDKSKLLA